jgi:predicted DCC family thiol-disulfide oxidoreductase YuxK
MKIGVTLKVPGGPWMMDGSPQLTVLFDGSCSLCRASVARVRPFDRHGEIEFLDLHDPSSNRRFPNIDREVAMRSMQAVDRRGRVYTGEEAWAQIGLRLPGWKLLAWILLVPGIRWIARFLYLWIARNRYRWNREACADGSCALHLPAPTDSAAKH